ncbi:hypothetical protein [Nitrosomonas sp.]|uniref:hypothetical protein n=1 Tax=Nitrosomonas sp. TaxID=42353 RepID=UPI0025D244A0|nr:hypothetical protein [Nitrosomonas sp.]MBY0483460.1 hypothetical protein [Nitrosomonas sp.]
MMKMASKKKPHRNEKFRQLLRERFNNNQRAMSEELNIAPSLVSRYAKDKGVGEDMRIHIEDTLRLGSGWFDQEYSPISIKDDNSLLKMLGATKDGISVTEVEKLKVFLSSSPEQQNKAINLIEEMKTIGIQDSGKGNKGK